MAQNLIRTARDKANAGSYADLGGGKWQSFTPWGISATRTATDSLIVGEMLPTAQVAHLVDPTPGVVQSIIQGGHAGAGVINIRGVLAGGDDIILRTTGDTDVTLPTSGNLGATGGNVSNVGTPNVNQLAIWTDATHIQGITLLPAASHPAHTGDVTTVSGVLTTTIAANAVSYAKMQNISANNRLLGSGSAGAGLPPAEIIVGAGLTMTGTTLTAATGNVSNVGTPANTQLAVWTDATHIQGIAILAAANFPALTGDVTTVAGALATTIANNAVTLAKMAQIAQGAIFGRASVGVGNVEVLNSLPFAFTGDVTRAIGSNAQTLAAGNAGNLNSGTLLAARMPALTGDVITSTGAVATTYNNAVPTAKGGTGGTLGAEPPLGNPGTSGFILSSTTGGVRSWIAPPTAGSTGQCKITLLTTGTTYTVTAGCISLIFEVVGGGGGGGGALASASTAGGGGGGGGGGYSRKYIQSPAASYTTAIGGGGNGGTNIGTDGTAGGSTTINTSLVVGGGGSFGAGRATGHAQAAISGAGGTGGSATTGDVRIPGGDGGHGMALSNLAAIGGVGGGSFLGPQTKPGATSGSAGVAGNNYGGGGSGASSVSTSGFAGGAGAGGCIIVTEFF